MRVLVFAGADSCPASVEQALSIMACEIVRTDSRDKASVLISSSCIDIIIVSHDNADNSVAELVGFMRSACGNTTLISISAARAFGDQIEALAAGADDVVSSETEPGEVVARLQARMTLPGSQRVSLSSNLEIGNTMLPRNGLNLLVNGQPVHMPRQQFLLVSRMMSRMDCLLTYATISTLIWPERTEHNLDERSMRHIQVLLTYVRRHLRDCDSDLLVETIHGTGIWAMDRSRGYVGIENKTRVKASVGAHLLPSSEHRLHRMLLSKQEDLI